MQTEPPLLVLLPGMDGTGKLFQEFVAALGPRVESQIIEYPSDELLSYEQLVDLVETVIPRTRPFVLLGESFSGPIALRLASRQPQNLVSLILCASFFRNPRPQLRHLGGFTSLLIPRLIPRPIVEYMMFGRYGSVEAREQFYAVFKELNPNVIQYRSRQVLSLDDSVHLNRIQVPCLYLQGEFDQVVSAHNGQAFCQQVSHTKLHQLPTAHMLLQSEPQTAADLVIEFVQQCFEKHDSVSI